MKTLLPLCLVVGMALGYWHVYHADNQKRCENYSHPGTSTVLCEGEEAMYSSDPDLRSP